MSIPKSEHDEASSESWAASPQARIRPEVVSIKIEQMNSGPEDAEETNQNSHRGVPLLGKVESRMTNGECRPAASKEHDYVVTEHNGEGDSAKHQLLKSRPSYLLTRKHPFTVVDKKVLLDIFRKFSKVIDDKRTDGATTHAKNIAWDRITAEYNGHPLTLTRATSKQLRRLRQNLKQRQRDSLLRRVAASAREENGRCLATSHRPNENIFLSDSSDVSEICANTPEMAVEEVIEMSISPHTTTSHNPPPPLPTHPLRDSGPNLSLTSQQSHVMDDQKKFSMQEREYEDRCRQLSEVHLLEVEALKRKLLFHQLEVETQREVLRAAKAKADLAELEIALRRKEFATDASAGAVPFRNECPVCRKTLATPSGLQRHLANHSRESFTCRVCERQFFKQETHDKHFKVHEKPSSYPCDQCQKTFKSKSNLHQHLKLHLVIKPYYCDICEKSFAINCHYKRHIEAKKCVKPSSLTCSFCNKDFDKELSLKAHLKSHESNRPFRCDSCDMTFIYKHTLVRHVQVHNRFRPFKCKYCDKTFTSSGLLKPHLRKHTGERPYKCDVCSKGFSHKQNMERHKLRHNKVKRLVCEICQKRFPRESRLKYHMRTHLIDKLPFKCPLCHKCYSHRQNIQRHYKKKHPNDTYECKQTDASVASVIWDALTKKQQEENHYEVLPEEESEYEILPIEKVEIKVELHESSDEEFLSEIRNRDYQDAETIIP